MIRVAIADDHDLFRQGVRQLIEVESDIRVVGEAADGLEIQRVVEDTTPDVVLMDVSMPVADGISATREITRTAPHPGVIVLSMYYEEGYVFQAIRAGASGYLSKNCRAEELVAAIRQVAHGASVLDPQMIRRVFNEFNRLSSQLQETTGIGGLTETELQVLRLIATGLSNRQIAGKLGFAESTVKNKLSVIFEKIGVEDRTQAAIFAITHGLLPEMRAER